MRLLALLLTVALVAVWAPAAADHVANSEVRWACGFSGTQRPENCGIDPIDVPRFSSEAWVDDDELILGVSVDGIARAYPVSMLDRHEIVNDEFGATGVAVTWCPLCGSGVSFNRDVTIDGRLQRLSFEASGFLYKHDLVMWDRETETLWTQIRGEAIGHLEGSDRFNAHEELKLAVIPTEVTTWGSWRAAHPHTTMLTRDSGPGGYGGAYPGYRTSCSIGVSGQSQCDVDGVHAKQPVLGVVTARGPVGYVIGPQCLQTSGGGVPCGVAHAGGVHVDEAAGVVITTDGFGGAKAFLLGDHRFSNDDGVWTDESGHPWALRDGLPMDGGDGLEAADSLTLYWFAWKAHHPETSVWVQSAEDDRELRLDDGKLPGFRVGLAIVMLLGLGVFWRLTRRNQP